MTAQALLRNRQLILPHMDLPDFASLNFAKLKQTGFRGVVFDKDNTLTAPYSLQIVEKLRPALNRCLETFGSDHTVVFSNTLGSKWDQGAAKALAFEKAHPGLRVLRHTKQKPEAIEDVQKYFVNCEAQDLVIIGDRYLTDILFGNAYGMFTIHTSLLTTVGENTAVKFARSAEHRLVEWARRAGVTPPLHRHQSLAETFVQKL